MPGPDSDHWLYRLTPEEWLRAAESELGRAREALGRKQQRGGVAGARRAAGMAWNAVLCATSDETGYGRSYMEHLQVLAKDQSVPEVIRNASRRLLDAPLAQTVVVIGKGDDAAARAAEAILGHARERVSPRGSS